MDTGYGRRPGRWTLKSSLFCTHKGRARHPSSGKKGKATGDNVCQGLKHLARFDALNLDQADIHFLLIKISHTKALHSHVGSLNCLPLGNPEPAMGKFSAETRMKASAMPHPNPFYRPGSHRSANSSQRTCGPFFLKKSQYFKIFQAMEKQMLGA